MDFDIMLITDRYELDTYIGDILRLQEYCDKTLKEDSWYIQTTKDEFYSLFDNKGILLLAMIDGMIEAVSIAGNYHADAEEVKRSKIRLNTHKCIYYDCVFVHPIHRGKRLQQRLMCETLAIAKKYGYKRSWCVVCPDNVYSLKNIEAVGYRKIGEINYPTNGWVRNVMYREI